MVPGKKMELNEGIRLLTGKSKIDIPLKKKEEKAVSPKAQPAAPVTAASTGPVTSKCTVEENGKLRTFTVTIEPVSGGSTSSIKLYKLMLHYHQCLQTVRQSIHLLAVPLMLLIFWLM